MAPSVSLQRSPPRAGTVRLGGLTVSTSVLLGLAAVAAPVGVAAVLTRFRGHLDIADDALLVVVVVVAVACSGRRLAGAVAAVSAALSFDLFLTRPYGSLRITRSSDLLTAVLLLVVGLTVGELAARGRRARRNAADGYGELHWLHSLGEMLAAGDEPHLLMLAAAAQLRQLLVLRECGFIRHQVGPITTCVTTEGSVAVGREIWPTGDLGLPTKQVHLPVRGNGKTLGYFVLTPTPGYPVPRQRLVAAVSIADLVGAAMATDHRQPARF
jgi:K+-sensing histidine kinase KdpD